LHLIGGVRGMRFPRSRVANPNSTLAPRGRRPHVTRHFQKTYSYARDRWRRSAEKSCAGDEAVIVEPNEIDSLPDVSVIAIGVT
jgi:hypothetical protein